MVIFGCRASLPTARPGRLTAAKAVSSLNYLQAEPGMTGEVYRQSSLNIGEAHETPIHTCSLHFRSAVGAVGRPCGIARAEPDHLAARPECERRAPGVGRFRQSDRPHQIGRAVSRVDETGKGRLR